jgi:hypothetical protein
MAHGVHPAMKGVEPARAHQAIHGRAAQPRIEQLPPLDHSVLSAGELRDDRDDFASYIDVNSSHPARVAPSAERNNAEL